MTTLADHWARLASVALLGTDRRDPPPPPPGPLAELVALAGAAEPAEAALVQVAALTAAHRAGRRPDPAPPPDEPAPHDARPPCPPAAARRLGEVLAAWPLLLGEWVERLAAGGWRLPPSHVPDLLDRTRNDPAARARIEEAAGPLAGWLGARFPELAARRTARAAAPADDPLPPDLAGLVHAAPVDVAITLEARLVEGVYGPAHRPALARMVCALPPGALPVVAAQLDGITAPERAAAVALGLAALARTRAQMIEELTP